MQFQHSPIKSANKKQGKKVRFCVYTQKTDFFRLRIGKTGCEICFKKQKKVLDRYRASGVQCKYNKGGQRNEDDDDRILQTQRTV